MATESSRKSLLRSTVGRSGVTKPHPRVPTKRTRQISATLSLPEEDVEIPDGDKPRNVKFVIALDYGTTFTSVSYLKFDRLHPPSVLHGEDIKSIRGYPDAPQFHGAEARAEVPTESWYSSSYFWGYQVQQQLRIPRGNTEHPQNRRIRWSKLLLYNNSITTGPRNQLIDTLNRLRKSESSVIEDYLIKLFEHTKQQLTETECYKEGDEVELVLCVPAAWSPAASRRMQAILEVVIKRSRFGSLNNLFIVSEPEAAAAYVLEAAPGHVDVRKGETFMVCDAGGGTVDVITYGVLNDRPLRLREVVKPNGELCGSSYINKALKAYLTQRLNGETYLDRGCITRESLIERVLVDFENNLKRTFDITKEMEPHPFWVPRLKRNSKKRFEDEALYLSEEEVADVFHPRLEKIKNLVTGQKKAAEQEGHIVQKVILVGGFAGSPSLYKYLKKHLFPTFLICPNPLAMSTAVAHGAVFRAMNKEEGPERRLLSSYGFLLIEEYHPGLRGHQAASPRPNHLDGKKYVHDCLRWLIKKDDVVPPYHRKPLPLYQVFGIDEPLELTEALYVSDWSREDHYTLDHSKNKGAEIAGNLHVDLTSLKAEKRIRPQRGPKGQMYYELHYELVIEVNGRNLQFYLLYPPKAECKGRGQISIAAAFSPGTE